MPPAAKLPSGQKTFQDSFSTKEFKQFTSLLKCTKLCVGNPRFIGNAKFNVGNSKNVLPILSLLLAMLKLVLTMWVHSSQTSTGNATGSGARIGSELEDPILPPACNSKVSTFELFMQALELPPLSKPKNLR